MAFGKSRPVEPVKHGWPSPSAQLRTSSGPKAVSIGSSSGARSP